MMMEVEKTYKVYMLIFPNGKRYIGMTGKSLEKRFNGGRGYRHCQKVWNAIKKFGWESVRHEVLLDGLTKQEAEREEIALIALYNTTENGYNIEHGGNCPGTHSIETRMKISAANKGKNIAHQPQKNGGGKAKKCEGNSALFSESTTHKKRGRRKANGCGATNTTQEIITQNNSKHGNQSKCAKNIRMAIIRDANALFHGVMAAGMIFLLRCVTRQSVQTFHLRFYAQRLRPGAWSVGLFGGIMIEK